MAAARCTSAASQVFPSTVHLASPTNQCCCTAAPAHGTLWRCTHMEWNAHPLSHPTGWPSPRSSMPCIAASSQPASLPGLTCCKPRAQRCTDLMRCSPAAPLLHIAAQQRSSSVTALHNPPHPSHSSFQHCAHPHNQQLHHSAHHSAGTIRVQRCSLIPAHQQPHQRTPPPPPALSGRRQGQGHSAPPAACTAQPPQPPWQAR